MSSTTDTSKPGDLQPPERPDEHGARRGRRMRITIAIGVVAALVAAAVVILVTRDDGTSSKVSSPPATTATRARSRSTPRPRSGRPSRAPPATRRRSLPRQGSRPTSSGSSTRWSANSAPATSPSSGEVPVRPNRPARRRRCSCASSATTTVVGARVLNREHPGRLRRRTRHDLVTGRPRGTSARVRSHCRRGGPCGRASSAGRQGLRHGWRNGLMGPLNGPAAPSACRPRPAGARSSSRPTRPKPVTSRRRRSSRAAHVASWKMMPRGVTRPRTHGAHAVADIRPVPRRVSRS